MSNLAGRNRILPGKFSLSRDDVVQHTGIEYRFAASYDHGFCTQRLQSHLPQVLTVNQDLPPNRIIETWN